MKVSLTVYHLTEIVDDHCAAVNYLIDLFIRNNVFSL